MTRYCPDCGTPHECESQVEQARRAEVEIEKLRTHRDIEVARISAHAAVETAESGAAEEAARAEGVVEGAEAMLDAAAGEPPAAEPGPEVIPEGEPIMVDTEPEPELDAPPPPETPTVPEPSPGGRESGWWAGYR